MIPEDVAIIRDGILKFLDVHKIDPASLDDIEVTATAAAWAIRENLSKLTEGD